MAKNTGNLQGHDPGCPHCLGSRPHGKKGRKACKRQGGKKESAKKRL